MKWGWSLASTSLETPSSSGFFESGSTATWYGARRQSRRRTVRVSPSTSSSWYAASRNAIIARVAPAAGSIT